MGEMKNTRKMIVIPEDVYRLMKSEKYEKSDPKTCIKKLNDVSEASTQTEKNTNSDELFRNNIHTKEKSVDSRGKRDILLPPSVPGSRHISSRTKSSKNEKWIHF